MPGQHAPECLVNIKRNGWSTCSGIYKCHDNDLFTCNRLYSRKPCCIPLLHLMDKSCYSQVRLSFTCLLVSVLNVAKCGICCFKGSILSIKLKKLKKSFFSLLNLNIKRLNNDPK
jgi:hypothetical protein